MQFCETKSFVEIIIVCIQMYGIHLTQMWGYVYGWCEARQTLLPYICKIFSLLSFALNCLLTVDSQIVDVSLSICIFDLFIYDLWVRNAIKNYIFVYILVVLLLFCLVDGQTDVLNSVSFIDYARTTCMVYLNFVSFFEWTMAKNGP